MDPHSKIQLLLVLPVFLFCFIHSVLILPTIICLSHYAHINLNMFSLASTQLEFSKLGHSGGCSEGCGPKFMRCVFLNRENIGGPQPE